MAKLKPTLAKGTRDFSPIVMEKRNYIFNTIKTVFKKYGYSEIQTPSFENLDTLTGKYGEEGDQLIFKILNSGDYLSKISKDQLSTISSKALTPIISEKALRYDLTVPFARYVVMHQNEITYPFKRYQIQPVWRADRPQRGRYREFYQCDADVVGSDSLLNEAEFIAIYFEVLQKLGLKDFNIKINNRKVLAGIADVLDRSDLLIEMTVAIDKLDKIGVNGVKKELIERGFTDNNVEKLSPILESSGDIDDQLNLLKSFLGESVIGKKGIEEIEEVISYVGVLDSQILEKLQLDITLARGLNYYTGTILEVKTNEVVMGSIGGGGRYDDLTGMFGLAGLTGVGISFGADRIYDVLEELNLFPEDTEEGTKILISNFDSAAERYALPILQRLRAQGIAVEIYPTAAKLKKQMSYAHTKNIPFVILVGEEEMQKGVYTLKDMKSGDQQQFTESELLKYFGEQ
ncbi:histidine--tRNA ligase [Albibacterium bauzanense]|uniref:Histidine--tRNA ligase n=1 Tax=Albibacterium bauzanense TaxID=653929 RepID=A0A4R1LVZ6_9SPHI|nr:histidine--tRNA ligase [Albibacterium bauzanense]TCK82947.1 histidyl-tRNA synthetase [Albibacterium bauzanense]